MSNCCDEVLYKNGVVPIEVTDSDCVYISLATQTGQYKVYYAAKNSANDLELAFTPVVISGRSLLVDSNNTCISLQWPGFYKLVPEQSDNTSVLCIRKSKVRIGAISCPSF